MSASEALEAGLESSIGLCSIKSENWTETVDQFRTYLFIKTRNLAPLKDTLPVLHLLSMHGTFPPPP